MPFWWVLCATAAFLAIRVDGHGYLMDPPARNSMWRVGYPNPINFDDNALYCGGFGVQWDQNGGKCGLCGDPWDEKQPRSHEAGGYYGRGLIGQHYLAGQIIDVWVVLSTGHAGYFEFYICPHNDPKTEATQECLDKHPLYIAGTQETKYYIDPEIKRGDIRYRLQLPPRLTCTQCVMQWHYTTGNGWGTCANGTESMGCGPQENFVNCADVTVQLNTGALPPGWWEKFVRNPHIIYVPDDDGGVKPLIVKETVCLSTDNWNTRANMDEYCQSNCLRYPPTCDKDKCHCLQNCTAIGDIALKPYADVYCMDRCLVSSNRKTCPRHRCRCI